MSPKFSMTDLFKTESPCISISVVMPNKILVSGFGMAIKLQSQTCQN